MGEPVGIAIVGCGWAGARHAQAWEKTGAEIRWAVDLDMARANSLKESLPGGSKVRAAMDYRHPLADPDVDAVDICLPHNLHAPVTVEATAAGKHVLCEKPMAGTLKEADRMIEAAGRAGVVLMISENVRFSPVYLKVRELLQGGVIGRPALIQMTRQAYLKEAFIEDRPWFLNAEVAAGGIMMSGGIHDFETMRMLIGEVDTVFSFRARQRFLEMEGDDTSVALVRFRDGTVGTLVESFVTKCLTTASGSEIHTLRIDGDLGRLAIEDGQTIRLFSERDDMLIASSLTGHDIHVPKGDTFALIIEQFLHSIRTGEEPVTSGRSQRRPLEIVLAAYQSMESGQPVRLTQIL